MRIQTLTLFLTAMIIVASPADAQGKRKRNKSKHLPIGAEAVLTDVEMTGTDDEAHSIESEKGDRGTLVMFSCNHCPVVVGYESRISRILNAYQQKGIGVIVINSNDIAQYPADDLEHMKKRGEEQKFEFPYVIDDTSDVARAFGASKTPECFLFDEDLKLAYWGAIDDSPRDANDVSVNYLTDAMDSLIAGEEVKTREAKAVGCSIKMRAQKKPKKTESTQEP